MWKKVTNLVTFLPAIHTIPLQSRDISLNFVNSQNLCNDYSIQLCGHFHPIQIHCVSCCFPARSISQPTDQGKEACSPLFSIVFPAPVPFFSWKKVEHGHNQLFPPPALSSLRCRWSIDQHRKCRKKQEEETCSLSLSSSEVRSKFMVRSQMASEEEGTKEGREGGRCCQKTLARDDPIPFNAAPAHKQ